jgi:glycosidase
MTTWIGNHDIPRAVHFANREITNCREGSHIGNSWTTIYSQPTDPAAYERMALSYAFLFTSPGIPMIYYGDEIGLAGGGDPDNRRMMPWDDSTLLPDQISLREAVTQLAWIRATHPALTRGERLTWYADDNAWAYTMSGCADDADDVSVILNRGDDDHVIELPPGTYSDLMSGDLVSGGPAAIRPRSFRILNHL